MSTSTPVRDLTRNLVHEGPLVPLGYQQITSLSSAQTLTVPSGATVAIIQAETQNLRWRDDGTAPTSSIGMLIVTTLTPFVYLGNLSNIQLIQASGGAVANISYYQ